MPEFRVASFPVRVRYGLVWLFPGDPALAAGRTIPDIPELEGPGRWACRPLSFTWTAHHSMIIDNVSDFTHAHLHRKYRPFGDARLLRCETVGDSVHVAYDTEVGRGRISGLFVDHRRINTNHMELCYQYPYQWSNTDDAIKHWLFVLPIDEHRTRMFFLFYFKSFKIPFTGMPIPRARHGLGAPDRESMVDRAAPGPGSHCGRGRAERLRPALDRAHRGVEPGRARVPGGHGPQMAGVSG